MQEEWKKATKKHSQELDRYQPHYWLHHLHKKQKKTLTELDQLDQLPSFIYQPNFQGNLSTDDIHQLYSWSRP